MTARSLFKDVIQVGFIYLIALTSLFVADIIFGRLLSVADYGKFSFVRQTIIFTMTLTFLGTDSALIRIISKKDLNQFKWKRFSKKISLIFLVVAFLVTLIIKVIYSLEWSIAVIIFLCSSAGSGVLLFSALFRSNSKFTIAQLSTQLWKIVLGICSIGLLIFQKVKLVPSLILLLVAYFTNFIFSYMYSTNFSEGSEEIPLRKVFSEGLLFWVNSGVLLLTSLADQFIIVKLLGYEAFAPYAASWNIIGIVYILIATSIGFVIVPPLIQKKLGVKSLRNLFFLLLVVSLVIGLVLIKMASPMVEMAYGGKFSPDSTLVLMFIAIGTIRLIYVLPSAIITAWGTTKNIGEFSVIGSLGILLNIYVAILLIPEFNIVGAAVGSLAGWAFRFTLGVVQSIRINMSQKS